MNASAGLGEVTGACSQAQEESSRREGKPSHWAAVGLKNDGGAAVSWVKKGLSRGPLKKVKFTCSWLLYDFTSKTIAFSLQPFVLGLCFLMFRFEFSLQAFGLL